MAGTKYCIVYTKRIIIISIMAINLGKLHAHKTTVSSMYASSGFLSKNKITVNEPVQTHFSVEGVQAYSPEEIEAMKNRQERVNEKALKEGQFVKVKNYEVSGDLDFEGGKLELAKAKESKKHSHKDIKDQESAQKPKKTFKTNIRNVMSAENQKLIKIEKQMAKKTALERRLQKLTKNYKQHFKGIDFRQGQNSHKQIGSQHDSQEQQVDKQRDIHDASEIEQTVSEGENTERSRPLTASRQPQAKTKPASVKKTNLTKDKTSKHIQQGKQAESSDVSFEEEEIYTQNDRKKKGNIMCASNTYSEKLGNAVHLLFS